MADNFSALRTSRGEPSLFEQVRTTAQLPPEAQYEMTSGASDTQFEKGLRSGAAGLTAGSFANEALSQEVGGDTDWQRSRDLALQTQAQGQMYAPRVSSLRDIGSLEDAGDFAAGAIGQGAMSMAPTLATALLTRGRGKFGAATSFAGGATTAYGLERGEAALNQYADPTLAATSAEDRDLAATTKGVINAGLEAIVPAGLAGSILRKPAGSFLGHVGRESLTEGLTEAAQQGVGFGAEKYLDPNRQLDPWDVADAFAAGALTGGGVSAATRGTAHGAQALADRFARGPEAAPVQEQGPAAEPPMDAAPPGTPLLPAPDDGSGGGIGGLFDTLNERFGPGVREQAQRTKDYVSDTIDRMGEAAKTAQSPSDFLRQVFGNSSEEAAADLRPDIEDPSVLNAADPAAALQQRDAERQQRAARFAEELLSDPATPDAIKERVASFGGDFTNPEAQAFVARNLVSQRAGEKLTTAIADLIDLSKDFGGKAVEVGTDLAAKARDMVDEGMTATADWIVKKSLQDATPAEQATFNKLVFDSLTDEAKASPVVRQRLPELANAMLAFAARTGDLTKADLKTLSRMQDGLAMFRDPEALAAQLTEYAGLPRTEDSFLSRIKRVTNAQQDLRQPNSFLYSSLTEEAKDSLRPAQLNQLARLVDDFTLSDASKAQGEKVLAGLTAAFGSKESAQAVLDYYQQQNRADLRFAPNEMLTEGGMTERDGAPAPTYQFADAKAMRPYRAFAGQMSSEGGMRRRLRESTIAGAALRRSSPGGARVRPVKMSQYVADTGGNPETEVRRIAADLKDRIAQHEARKNEDRSQQINQLQGELTLMRQAYKNGGAQAALDLYEVLQVSGQEQNDTIASDEDVAKMSTLADAKDAKETRVTFQREDGSKFTLSAESMWKTLGAKEGSGKGENTQARAKRLFADAVASVLARPEVAKMVTPMEKILIDRKLGVQAKKKGNPEYRAMVADALKAAEGSIKSPQTTLDAVVDEYLDAADNEAKSEEYGSRREEIEGIIEKNIDQLSERLDAAREGKGPMAGNMPAQAVARQKLRMYRDAQGQLDAIKFDEEFDERDNNRSGIPGADESGPMGPNGLPRTRMNEELGNTGTRYSEEDTGLGVGVEKRGQKAQPSAEKKQTPSRVILPQISRYAAKDQAKSDRANKFIGRGSPGSSTAAYAEAWGDRANVGEYSPEDTVFISVNGNRPGALSPPWPEIKKAMTGGATLITDVPADRARSFNTGERAVADFLDGNGYFEESPGTWVRGYIIDNATGQKRYAPLGMGEASAEKKGAKAEPKPKTLSEAAVNALYDIAVKENYGRLDTPEKVLRYAAMARALMDQLGQIPEGARTDQQQELLSKLRADFDQSGNSAFDWDMLFDGMNPTDEQRALLEDIVTKAEAKKGKVVKKSFVGAKYDPAGAAEAEAALDSGADAAAVWSENGWFRGPDGKMRKEVNDDALFRKIEAALADKIRAQVVKAGLFRTEQLTAKLPALAKRYYDSSGADKRDATYLVLHTSMADIVRGTALEGVLSPAGKQVTVNIMLVGNNRYLPDAAKIEVSLLDSAFNELAGDPSTTQFDPSKITVEQLSSAGARAFLHEFQHALQAAYGLTGGTHGGDPNYYSNVGEIEAFDVMSRTNTDRSAPPKLAGWVRAGQKRSAMDIGGSPKGKAEPGTARRTVTLKNGESITLSVEASPKAFSQLVRVMYGEPKSIVAKNATGEEIGRVTFMPDGGPIDSFVRDQDRRKGVASAMYDAVEEAGGQIPSEGDGNIMSDDARAFRQSRKSTMKPKRGRPGKIDQQAILDEIARIRGKDVKVAFAKFADIGASGEFSMNKDKTERLIKIAVNASNPMGTAWHESLHDFFAMLDEMPSHRSIKKDLLDAAEAPQVKKRLRELLAKHPAALKQIEENAEERVAYMYQFWAEGLLTLGPTGTSVFDRVRQLFHDLFGLISTEQRASDLLEALHEGKFAEPSTVAEVLADMSGDRLGNKMEKAAPELTAALGKVFQTAPDRLRAYQNDTLNELADMFSSERGKLGFIQKRFQQQGVWENKLAGVLAGTTAQERRAALGNLQAMKTPSTKLEKDLAKFFSEMHGYMSEAGVKTLDSKTKKWVPLREVRGYFPRVFDRHEIMKDRAGFISLLQQHGNMDLKQANAAVDALTHGTGQLELAENEHALGFTPYAQAVQDRRFTFINPGNAADFAKYQVKDLADVTTSYVKQAVHRAEYSRMFGNDGEVITKMISESGIKNRKELEDIGKVVQGLEGSLGNGMSTATKELMSGIMTLQNVVVLPLAIFSQMIDPVVLAARSGELKDAGTAYMTAIKRLVGKEVDGEELANMLGIISQDSVLEAMGAAYGTAHMSKRMRDINRVFFKYNGMQGWNNSMRIAATAAGERYLISNKGNDKALAELGLTSKDVKVNKNGRLDVSSPKVQQAMYRFVDQAVLRPSASNRPVWMSDPRFLLVAHLKQFTYAMHNVVLKRASRELSDGNPKPWGILMLAMPVILAADMAKFALTGTAPSSWGFKDYLVHAVERSGLLSLGDFGVQATRGVDMGKLPGEGLLGPTFENLMEILRWIGGDPRTSLGDVIDRTVPGSRFI